MGAVIVGGEHGLEIVAGAITDVAQEQAIALQPDGQRSADKATRYIAEALGGGGSVAMALERT